MARRKRKNPELAARHGLFEIVTRRGRGPLMWYDGKKFTNNGHPKTYSFRRAVVQARELLKRYDILRSRGYRVWLSKVKTARRKNPLRGARPESLDEAARKFEDFTGHRASKIIEVNQPTVKKGLVLGELDLIGYRVKRDGIEGDRLLSYDHSFRKRSRPLLAVSEDGKQLLIVGGRYEFTEAGIEDR